MGCCILAVAIASTFTLLFPLIGPAVVLLVLLTLVGKSNQCQHSERLLIMSFPAHRFLVGYVYARTHSQTGGLLQLWLLRRFATLTALQPLVLGLILLTRRLWEEGGVLCGTALLIVVFVEIFCARKLREPGRKSLSPITRNSLDTFARAARVHGARGGDEESTDLVSESLATAHRTRGSFASVLEMMSATLAVQPSQAAKGPVPLRKLCAFSYNGR